MSENMFNLYAWPRGKKRRKKKLNSNYNPAQITVNRYTTKGCLSRKSDLADPLVSQFSHTLQILNAKIHHTEYDSAL